MRNEKLIAAREDRGWSQAVAAEKIGVSRVAYARWEEQGIIPRMWAINRAREAFKMTPEQLGFRKYSSSISSGGIFTQTSLEHGPEEINAGSSPALVKVGISALSLARQVYGYSVNELLLSAEQELRRLDTMTQPHEGKNSTRREALEFLIGLPLALMGLNSIKSGKATLLAEEVLPSYVTAVHACWRLYLERLSTIDKDVPATVVPRRVELLNRKADASLKLGDMEQTCTYVEAAGTFALQLGSDLRFNEACETYQQTQIKWPHERRVKALADLFKSC